MLYQGTVQPRVLDVLRILMETRELDSFYLVGGTALSLYFGHRLSVDLDLFSIADFNNEAIIVPVEKKFPGFTYRNIHNPIGIFAFIDDIKVDFIKHHNHPMIAAPLIEDGIRLAGIPDLIAMKIAAIMKRAVKKDFWDIAELLNYYTVENLVQHYTKKYPSQQLLISVPYALTYFIDAEESETPVSLKGQTWETVKKFIQQKVNDYLQ